MKKSKYGAKKVIVTEDGTMFEVEQLKKYNITDISGIKFDSKMEAHYYLDLLSRMKNYDQSVLKVELQPVYVLQDKPKIKYIPDFRIYDGTDSFYLVDVKGTQTTAFRLKLRLFKAKFPDIELRLVTKKGGCWAVTVA